MHQINYGTHDFYFELKRSNRKTLAIEVHPDSSIIVIAPENSEIADIKTKIIKRGQWILKQQSYFEQFLPRTPERKYISGETHYYLGKGYLLKIRLGKVNQVKLKGGQFEVTCKDAQPGIVKKLLAEWYYRHAEKKFLTIRDEVYLKFKCFTIELPELEIKRMSKRWGSCTGNGKIIINPEIIKAPTKCIEYLIIHEMCHLIEHNHNAKFYALLSQQMPNWEKWKNRLEQGLS